MNVPIRPVGEVSYVAASDDGRKVFVTAMSVEDRAGSHGGEFGRFPDPAPGRSWCATSWHPTLLKSNGIV